MRVCLVSPAWRRFAVTRLALAQRAHLCGVLAGRGHEATSVIVADDDNLDIASELGFHTVERDNEFLGRRFNDGVEWACRQWEADVVVTIGSDDWMHPDCFDRMPLGQALPRVPTDAEPTVVQSFPPGPEVVAGRTITLVDLGSGRGRVCRARNRHGVIPWLIHRAALEPSGFRPIPETQQKGIDGALIAGLNCSPEWVFHDPHDVARVDFKSDTNLNSFALIAGAIGDGPELADPWALLAEHYPAELVRGAQVVSAVQSMLPERVAA